MAANMSASRLVIGLVGLLSGMGQLAAAAADDGFTLVDKGKSTHTIVHAPDAPASVRDAAREIARVVEASTGAKLPIATEGKSPLIALGDTPAARAAGIDASALADERFRLVTKGQDLFIVGRDWADGEKKWDNCDSTGTLYGAYEFLERVVGVRWLMPGPLGEDIPDHRDRLSVPALAVEDGPRVPSRNLSLARRDDADVKAWLKHRRMGRSIQFQHAHNWSEFPATQVLIDHPEYMPLQADGTRQKLAGDRSWGHTEHRLCVSNPGLVTAFADSLSDYLAKYPKRHASMAPADGGEWCRCKDCQARILTPPAPDWDDYKPYNRSVTPLVFDFYQGVAKAVAARHPDRYVGGLAYQDYVFPPAKGARAEPNIFVSIAHAPAYGFKFYRPATARQARMLIEGWAACVRNLGWSDYSTWMRNCCGAPLPPGLPILETTFPAFGTTLKQINYQGQDDWGSGAAHNYVVSRLIWDNTADARAIYAEYLDRAYGPAASHMRRLHEIVEAALSKYIVDNPRTDHEIWYDTAAKVYAPIFPEIERIVAAALAEPLTDVQRRRLQILDDNLVVLHWNLRRAGLLAKDAAKSPHHRDDDAFERFREERKAVLTDFDVYRKYRWLTSIWAPEQRTLKAVRLPAGMAAPQIDGDATDAAWKQAESADDFKLNQGDRPSATEQTRVRLVHDGKTLYVAWECDMLDPAKIRTVCEKADSTAIFGDDVVEFLAANGPKRLECAVNAAGLSRTEPTVERQAAAKRTSGGWTAELAVPLAALGVAAADGPKPVVIRGNFTRRQPGPPIFHSTWSRVEERLADARGFGTIELMPAGKPPRGR
jgi:hypothetical protein